MRERKEPQSQLFDAIVSGRLDSVVKLLDQGVSPNSPSEDGGTTPLHVAIEHQHEEIVKLLIDRGADIEKPMWSGWTPLFHAIDIEQDAAFNLNELPAAATITTMLLEAGVRTDLIGPRGETPLIYANRLGHVRAVAVLNHYATIAKTGKA